MRGHMGKGKKRAKRCSRKARGNPHLLSAHPHAAQRAVPGWRGGLGRVGADLASAGSMRPPPSPARHVSTAWLATTNVSREAAARQAKTGSSPHPPAEKQHATTPASQEAPPTAAKHLPGQNENDGPSPGWPATLILTTAGAMRRTWPLGPRFVCWAVRVGVALLRFADSGWRYFALRGSE